MQNLRKKSGFAVEDRIVLHVHGDTDVQRALKNFGDRVTGETLDVMGRGEAALPYTDNSAVDGLAVSIAIDRRARDRGGEHA